jgi:hypothetical protein
VNNDNANGWSASKTKTGHQLERRKEMDEMQILNSHLSHKVMQEMLHDGGPAHYRQGHLGSKPNAEHLAELKQSQVY